MQHICHSSQGNEQLTPGYLTKEMDRTHLTIFMRTLTEEALQFSGGN